MIKQIALEMLVSHYVARTLSDWCQTCVGVGTKM